MCGIAGFLKRDFSSSEADGREILRRMCDAVRHRGPDSAGCWLDGEAGIGLGHRRLSILDLSANGQQPMASHAGRYVLSFNGEIYNFADLRSRLEGEATAPDWRGHSDTEVLLEAIARWGLDHTLEKLDGMFAFAVWDRERRELSLARDCFGEKPLYYGWVGSAFVFASELKALRQFPGFSQPISETSVATFLRYGMVPHPHTIYDNIHKLVPGTWLRVGSQTAAGESPAPTAFWSVAAAITDAMAHPFEGDDAQALELVDGALRKSVGDRMVSDVPLGAFLSGGIDSSTIVALMQQQSSRRVRTFSIGNAGKAYDESGFAEAVAKHLGTEHTSLLITPDEARAVVPLLPTLYDEPFADSSQIPTCLVSQLARSSVTVALSGDGGDEVFGGYNRYVEAPAIWRKVGRLPVPVRNGMATAIGMLSPAAWDRIAGLVSPALPKSLRSGRAGAKLHKLSHVLAAPNEMRLLEGLLSYWSNPEAAVASRAASVQLTQDHPPPDGLSTFSERAMALDTRFYLSDDILTKVDRASMSVGLEARVPFLSKNVFALAWSLPLRLKIRPRRGKHILRQVLHRFVPEALVERPKQGFAIPVGEWLRHELRDWADALLRPAALARHGILDAAVVRACWDEHLSGRRDHEGRLWTVLMLQAWCEEQAASPKATQERAA